MHHLQPLHEQQSQNRIRVRRIHKPRLEREKPRSEGKKKRVNVASEDDEYVGLHDLIIVRNLGVLHGLKLAGEVEVVGPSGDAGAMTGSSWRQKGHTIEERRKG
ncbi:hypothetical protein JHK82_047754 [Glycine max]|nr:hypothetical protein JHK86_047640 [Glycine max]KAG4943610.1 hypothetical protein JHK85_048256 [Glycine max]KAG5097900.1 hypothetical protein JHK82_047754 [Glycine max]KAG5102697.1 hypothetical protein JHK84_047666 [Glycine max]